MNNNIFEKELINEYSKEQLIIIENILDKHFIIGKNNKKNMIKDFIEQLDIDELEADKLYNKCMSIIMINIKNKITHPFKKELNN